MSYWQLTVTVNCVPLPLTGECSSHCRATAHSYCSCSCTAASAVLAATPVLPLAMQSSKRTNSGLETSLPLTKRNTHLLCMSRTGCRRTSVHCCAIVVNTQYANCNKQQQSIININHQSSIINHQSSIIKLQASSSNFTVTLVLLQQL